MFIRSSDNSSAEHIAPIETKNTLQQASAGTEIEVKSATSNLAEMKQCGPNMKYLLTKFQQEISANNKNIFHLAEHAAVSQVVKENYLESTGSFLSISEFRSVLPQFNRSVAEFPGKVMEPVDLIKFTRLISDQDLSGLSSYLSDNPELINKTINDRTMLAFALANVKKEIDTLNTINVLIKQGFKPSVMDLVTAIDAGKSFQLIDEISGYIKSELSVEFNIDGVSYNLVTYSAYKKLYDYSLHFYQVHGVGLSLIDGYNVLDFVNFEENENTMSSQELVSLAAQYELAPARASRLAAYLEYVKTNFRPEIFEMLSEQYLVSKKDNVELLSGKLDPQRLTKLQGLIEKNSSIYQQLRMLKSEADTCIPTTAQQQAQVKESTSSANINHTEQNKASFLFDGSLSQAEKMFKAALLISDDDLADVAAVRTAFDLIIQGDTDKGLFSLDQYLDGRSASDKSKVYSSLLTQCVIKMRSGGVIQQLMLRGANMHEKAIFMFINNNNVDAIEIYKKHHDIKYARSVQGLTPLEAAIKRKSDADLISRLQ
ncbi:hypothetical protein EOE67_13720 [Rheinheimera riviphila]|uniref:Uncharacterized protein n=1 Tax=Rheinheimera riviphila TaxID=1834037 RepID=A0A437QLU6_9GAMM|nr:hypothetical protein [Rheinheimera riviphila]RVU35430.1 hypothetical protein EOE67_13720 [Rheinheimera riviphila]